MPSTGQQVKREEAENFSGVKILSSKYKVYVSFDIFQKRIHLLISTDVYELSTLFFEGFLKYSEQYEIEAVLAKSGLILSPPA